MHRKQYTSNIVVSVNINILSFSVAQVLIVKAFKENEVYHQTRAENETPHIPILVATTVRY